MFSLPSYLGEDTLCKTSEKADQDEKGFASAQFVGLMALSIVLVATLVNVFTIEYIRSASFAAVREAARAGTQVVDLERALELGEEDIAIEACEASLRSSVGDLFSADPNDYILSCEIAVDEGSATTSRRFSMKASIKPKGVYMVPWARTFGSRLNGISATYEQKQASNPNVSEDEELPEIDDNDDCDVAEEGENCTPPTFSTTPSTTTSTSSSTTTTSTPGGFERV